MKNIAVFIADGSEELEVLTPVDLLRRTGATVDMVSVNGEYVTCSHGVVIKADKTVDKTDFTHYDCLVIPGGMPGAVNIASSSKAVLAITLALDGGKLVGAICASPAVVLAGNNILGYRKATCYNAPDFVKALGENYTGKAVEYDRGLITANGPKSAFEFSLAIAKGLGLEPKF